MLKKFITLLTLIIPISLFGNEKGALTIDSSTIIELIDSGTKLIYSATGDLNHDGIPDLALVLHRFDSTMQIINTGLGQDTIDSSPRVLKVILSDSTQNLTKIYRYQNIIVSHTDPKMSDPFRMIDINGDTLGIIHGEWYSAGSWYMSSNHYYFQLIEGDLKLILLKYNNMHRGTLGSEDYVIDFINGKKRYSNSIYKRYEDEGIPPPQDTLGDEWDPEGYTEIIDSSTTSIEKQPLRSIKNVIPFEVSVGGDLF